jgi:vitamin B12 transporter
MMRMHHTYTRSSFPSSDRLDKTTRAQLMLCGLLAAITSPLLAAEVEPIHVTATRLAEPVPVSMTVLDAASIENRHSVDVVDLLRLTPGISTTQPGGPGGISEVFLRSAESNFSIVLVDGVRMNDPSNPRGGGYDFSTLNPDEIERIEIARGSLSAVHGSDAMAGVINIVTKRPTADLSAYTRAEGGNDDFQRVSAGVSGPLSDALRGNLNASYVDFGDAVEGSSQRLASVQGGLEFGSAESGIGNVRSGARYAERDRSSFADASGGPLFAVLRDTDEAHAEETSAWAHSTRAFSSAWSMNTTASFFSRREQTTTPAIVPGVFDGVPAAVSDSRFRRAQVTVSQNYALSPAMEIGGGVDLQFEDGERDGELDLGFATLPSDFDMDRVVRAAYTEVRYQPLDTVQLYAAARADDSNEGSARASGRFAASYLHADSGISLHAGWSNGHKQPSFYSLGDTLVGNPDLRVETSETFEVGAEKDFSAGRLITAISAFRSRYEDLIDFDFATFRLVNRSHVRIDGIEASFTSRLTSTLTARLHATVSDIELPEADGASLLYRPESYGGLQFAWVPLSGWSLNTQLQYVGEREGSAVPTGPLTLKGYERVDVALSRELNAHTTLFLAADNVLDEDYQEAVGFPDAGVQFRFGAAVTF